MIKKTVLIMVILIVASFFGLSGCKTQNDILLANPEQPLSKACEFNGEFYFIHPSDHMLYKVNLDSSITLFYDTEMELFSLINDRLVFIDLNNNLIIENLNNGNITKKEWGTGKTYRTPLGFSYNPSGEVALYSDRIVYKNQKNQLVIMDYSGNDIKIIKKDIVTFSSYNGYICYVYKYSWLIGEGMKIMTMDLNGDYSSELIDTWVYKMQTCNDGVYYIAEDYNLHWLQKTIQDKEVLSLEWFDFAVSNNYIACVTKNGLEIYDKNTEAIENIDNSSNNLILNTSDKVLVYQNDRIYFYNYADKTQAYTNKAGECLNCVIFEDRIYIVFGNYNEDTDQPIAKSCAFYTMTGELLYSYE